MGRALGIRDEVLPERSSGRQPVLLQQRPDLAGAEQAHVVPFDEPEPEPCPRPVPPPEPEPLEPELPLELPPPDSESSVVGGRDDTVGVGPRSE